ncbi:MAG TPA: hypothetical protein VJ873_02140 [bacterium]|nr:hypothetical protein [bacterium]
MIRFKNFGVFHFVGCMAMFLLVLSSSWADSIATSVPRPKPFELWPATNDAAPTTFTKAAPEFQTKGKPWKFPHGAKVQVKIDASQVLHNVTPYEFGNNAAWWDHKDWFMDPDRIDKAKEAGIRFWRWPGGSSSDNYFWDGNYQGHTKDSSGSDTTTMTQPWAVSTDDFISFCRQTGSEAIFTVNYAAARYANVQEAADLAARWVKHCNIDMKFKVRYWEIGNEVYGPWEEGNKMTGKPQLTGDVYGKDLQVIAAAMKKVDPDIYVGAVAVDTDDGGDWTGFHWWMRDLLPQLKGAADYLILHQYFMWPFNGDKYTDPSNDVLFGNLHKLDDAFVAEGQMEDKYAPTEKGIPVALTEYNLMNANGHQDIELINGLFTSEVLGESIKAGYVNSNYWDWKNGLDKKLGGEHGMLASDDPSTPDNTPRPSYYAFALYNQAFGDKMVAADSSDPKVKIYASKFSGGELGLVIVNENDKNQTLNFDFTGFAPQGKLMGWVLTGKGLNEKQVSWNGEMGPLGGGGPFPINTIPPYRATFKANKPLQLPIQANSVTGVVLY